MALTTMLAAQLLLAGSDVFRATRSTADLAAQIRKLDDPRYDPSAPFYQVGMYDQTLPFYLARTTTLVAFRDELALGLDAEPAKGIAHEDDWIARWTSLPQGYAVMAPSTLARFAQEDLRYRELARDARRVVISRR
jgi:hypothetical protein